MVRRLRPLHRVAALCDLAHTAFRQFGLDRSHPEASLRPRGHSRNVWPKLRQRLKHLEASLACRTADAMIDRKRTQPAHANVIPLDARANAGKVRLARWLTGMLRALHGSRKHHGACEIRRYRHLICYTSSQPGLKIPRHKGHVEQSSADHPSRWLI
jgi:hypothetical protein